MEKKDLRIVFMGTPEFAVGTLEALVEGGYNVVAVVTQPDKPVGRHGNTLMPSEVKRYALEKGIPVLQPEKMKNPEFVAQLQDFKADLQVVVAFRMLPEVVWAMPRLGTFNVHAALLPQYRGAAPINWAVINGETVTGVTTFFLDHDIDTGRVILKRSFDIPDDADVEYVYDGLMKLGAEAAIDTIERIREGDGHVDAIPQEEMMDGALLKTAPKIFKDTCRIDWNMTSKRIYDFVRGLSPYPGAWTTMKQVGSGEEVVVKIYKTTKCQMPDKGMTPGTLIVEKGKLLVATGDGMLSIEQLQKAGKKKMDAAAFINGMRDIEACSFL
ncbi:MAG: methionyl-tRNA formyltransferase [Prevotella sp.]|nr:methionyl-tRNA formyltransferase [Prevotella sp.]MBR7055447.1 methionyl-tRNA formyltransferase [Prevotella sp.]